VQYLPAALADGGLLREFYAMIGVTLWVPGPWKDQSEFIKAIAGTGDGVIAAGGMLVEAAHQRHAMFEILEPHENLTREMFIGSGRTFDGATLEAIEGHKSIAALLIPDTGEDLAETIGTFTRAVRAAGGIAVKVHYSGLSHGWDRWEAELAGDQPSGLFRLLVVQVPDREAGVVSSFGMKQFSLADACVEDNGEGYDAAWALFEFNIYLRRELPALKDGHTFSRAIADARRYRLKHRADERYSVGHPYVNPHGVWELTFA
jgi:hypothetical protein